MRSRFLAFLILVAVISIPVWIYWYFFTKNTASLTVSVGGDDAFSLRLEWTLDNDNLPLADRFLVLEKECIKICTISPIAPVKYNLSIMSSEKTTIEDMIVIWMDEDKVVSYNLVDEITLESIEYAPSGDTILWESILASAQVQDPQAQYSLIGIDAENNIYTIRKIYGRTELGILTSERFTPLYVIPDGVGDFSLDRTGQYFIAPIGDTGTIVLSLDMSEKKEIPIVWVTGYAQKYWQEKIYTRSWILMLSGERYVPNLRFTDYIDISPYQRIWYIGADDSDRLALSNLPLWKSVLVLVDRSTGEDVIIKRGIDIDRFFYLRSTPVYMDQSGKVYKFAL